MMATDILRAMLDERGVEYETCDNTHFIVPATFWVDRNGDRCSALECVEATHGEGTLGVQVVMTPEQAIEASLCDGEYERKMDALLCRLTNGKFSKTRAYDLDFMESVVREEFEIDAATLEAETCFPALNSERDGLPYLDPWFVCSECGCQLTESRLGRIWQNYCPNCGRRIRRRRVDGE